MNSKSIFTSKTFWLNILALALWLADNAFFGGLVPDNIKMTIVAALNILNRFLTVGAVSLAGGK